ncbi:receptor-type tyrosine-protein phosphatase N2 isoform X2 [Harmonia axyridis]|uniref:receptor-type tyrosine-protein phosphatase N2 isoform X2 n=1 Tax=Harmonia axyridis TaxID=115357 RepID=UPI001E27927B|nr:receptor-type tyrosine-protein phosphatase N2 isoform X2 [Harmonia axyridis]
MPWPGTPLRIFLVLFVTFWKSPGLTGEGNVGCLFSNRLCLEDEWCFDDYAFGRCTPTGDIDEEDVFRFDLKRDELHELKRELQRLFALGYRWSHGYTQCRLQAMLYAMKHDSPFEEDMCSHLADQDLEGALKAMDVQDPMDPREVAIIKYTPSVEKTHGKYADEVYYPPNVEASARDALRNKILGTNPVDILDMPDPYAEYQVMKRAWIPQMHRRTPPVITIKSTRDFDDDPLEFLQPSPYEEKVAIDNRLRQVMEAEIEPPRPRVLSFQDLKDIYPLIKYMNENYLTLPDLKRILSPQSYQHVERLLGDFDHTVDRQEYRIQELEDHFSRSDNVPPERFSMTYNTPDKFREGWESKDSLEFLNRPRSYQEADEEEVPRPRTEEIFRELKNAQLPPRSGFEEGQVGPGNSGIFRELHRQYGEETWGKLAPNQRTGVYTEGGFVYPSDSMNGKSSQESLNEDLEKLLENNSNVGFKRPERLDVKKPGPKFPFYPHEGPRGAPHPNPYKVDQYEVEESSADYVFVGFNKNFDTWGQGVDVIKNISYLLHLEPSSFENGHVIKNVVTFKVLPNSKGLNASEVARRILDLKDTMSPGNSLKIIDAGLKDKAKMQAVLAAPMMNDNEFYIVIFMVCGVLGAMIVAATLLIIIRKHIKSKEKLQGLSKPDTEASKDYQELCRARMSAKGQPSGESVHGRITSLSKESEQSPSSRSSTSSWSEEPALHNMDISTGHIVLNYMEDHLKNKDRLEQEWVALCAYVAEPCATTVSLKKENAGKNRYPEIVPYDHSRVVLNDLSNANGSDYINASSITDHDPRNPAYIATQGPLPHTSADFWQLIWEQGAVVIVMLTRLTESGAAMCHRYWPEEGSERYHIYEVHLVSEHIWCDDYLVRSFYLKNLRTGETRTVTQFHFLSWAETGVPASTKALLEFRRKVNKSYRGRSCPIVVHCSDGAGRTGTYCLIDMVLSRMAKGAKEIDIAATLEHLRDQRVKMVATKQQFEFVLTAVAEEVHAILKVLPPQPTAPQPDKEK